MRELSIFLLPMLALVVALMSLARAMLDRKEFKKSVELLEGEVEETKLLLRRRGDIARELAHEVKHPLGAIACAARTFEHLKRTGADVDDTALKAMREHAEHALHLISDFLELSRGEGTEPEILPESVRLRDALDSVTRLLTAQADARGIRMRVVATEPHLSAYVDRRHLMQMLFNTLHNAIKFSVDGTEVRVIVTSHFPAPLVDIIIQDRGSGIEPELLQVIRSGNSSLGDVRHGKDPRAGLGIGLALTRRLAERNGGQLAIESASGVGTRVTISLPQPNEVHTDGQADSLRGGLAGRSVLLLEPRGEHGERLASLLASCGATVKHLTESAEVLAALAGESADIVLVAQDLCTESLSETIRGIAERNNRLLFLVESEQAGCVRCMETMDGAKPAHPRADERELVEVLVDIARPVVEH